MPGRHWAFQCAPINDAVSIPESGDSLLLVSGRSGCVTGRLIEHFFLHDLTQTGKFVPPGTAGTPDKGNFTYVGFVHRIKLDIGTSDE